MPLSDSNVNTAALNALLDLLPIGVAIAHDAACSRITVNPAAARLLGISAGDNASLSRSNHELPFKVFQNGREMDAAELPMQRAAAAGIEIRDFEVQVVRADGRKMHLFEYASPLRNADGRVVGSIGVFIDISAQREFVAEQNRMQQDSERKLRELNETLEVRVAQRTAEARARAEQLHTLALALADAEARERKRLAQLLHDQLQQLLSAAKLKAGLVRRVANEDQVKEQVQQVERLIESAIAESRSLTIELAPPILYEAGLNAAIIALARNIEQRRGLKFTLQCDPAAEPDAEPVRVLLFEAVREMLHNVLTHANATHVRVATDISTPGHVGVVIEDDGAGFDLATLSQPRERNEQHHLGLIEIRERLNHIGGDLQIRSEPGKGTWVQLLVPADLRAIVDEPARIPTGAPTPPPVNTGADRRTRVLVADDHAIFRDGLIGLLKQEDFIEVVGEAGDGAEAVALARQLHPDILIADISMPKLNGIEVTHLLSREQPHLRIIGLSMHDRADMSAAMKRAGAAAYLTKGGASEALIALLRTLSNANTRLLTGGRFG